MERIKAVRIVPVYSLTGDGRLLLAFAIEHYADFGPIERFSRACAQSPTLFAVLDYGSSSNGVSSASVAG